MVILFTRKHADSKAVVKVIASTRCRNLSQTLSLMSSLGREQCACWRMMCEGAAVCLVVFLVLKPILARDSGDGGLDSG
jgi:hypothetical protein